jgi:phosphate transport system substrate-binding protein
MVSRHLKESEQAKLNSRQIALDGIVVIVNKQNPVNSLSKEQIKNIYMGKVEKWSDLAK